MPLLATLSQNDAALLPKKGTVDSHSGGGGSLKADSEVTHSTIRSKLSAIVVMASQNGMTKMTRMAIVMTVTASQRRFHRRRCTVSMIGQVATTRVVAQMIAGKNGRNIQKQAAIKPVTNSTASVVRVRSEWPIIAHERPASSSRDAVTAASSVEGGVRRGLANLTSGPVPHGSPNPQHR